MATDTVSAADAARPAGVSLAGCTGCRWPLSGSGHQTLFCDEPAPVGSPYCAAHRRVAYVPTPVFEFGL